MQMSHFKYILKQQNDKPIFKQIPDNFTFFYGTINANPQSGHISGLLPLQLSLLNVFG